MARKKYAPEDIIRMLREAEVELANGQPMVAVRGPTSAPPRRARAPRQRECPVTYGSR